MANNSFSMCVCGSDLWSRKPLAFLLAESQLLFLLNWVCSRQRFQSRTLSIQIFQFFKPLLLIILPVPLCVFLQQSPQRCTSVRHIGNELCQISPHSKKSVPFLLSGGVISVLTFPPSGLTLEHSVCVRCV